MTISADSGFNDLSTTTLITALLHEPNWNAQLQLAGMIENRTDCYNVLPLCGFLLEPQQNRSVQRAVARCVSRHGFAQGFRWMKNCIHDQGNDTGRKLLAMRAISDFGRPAEAVPFYAGLCTSKIPAELRSDALFRLGRTRGPWAPVALSRLIEHDNSGIAVGARQSIAVWIDEAGGVPAAISQLSTYAINLVRRGDTATAEQALRTALQIAESHPGAQGLIYRELRGRVAA